MQDLVFESTRGMTQEEFASWVEKRGRWDQSRYELLNGRVLSTPPAGYPHGSVGNAVQCALGNAARARKLGRVFDSSQGFEFPSGDTVEPDHSFVSKERWAAAPKPEPGKFLKVVPDLIVEVLSTSTASRDRGEKKGIYEQNGVREYWLVDTRAREVTVFRLKGKRYGIGKVHGEGRPIRSTALVGLALDPAEFFSE